MPFPIEGKCYITQGYGFTDFARSTFGKSTYKAFGGQHPGVDFGTGRINLPVVSLIAGKVVRASMEVGWGNHVEIQGADGWNRQYGHLHDIAVKVGQLVSPGTHLGHVGSTGASTAIHLHYGSRRRKTLGGWEYRNPSDDFKEIAEKAIMPTSKLIMSTTPEDRSVYVFNSHTKFPIPDWGTFLFLFGKDAKIEEVDPDILTKIPTGDYIPSLT